MFEPVDSTTMTVRPYRTMLPPIWVAACDSQRRRNARVAEDRERRSRRRPRDLVGAGVVGVAHGRPSPGRRTDRRAALSAGIAALDEPDEAALERRAVEQDVAAAALAAQADVGAEAVHEPRVAAARMGRRRRTTSPSEQLEHASGRSSGGSGYQSRGLAMGRDEVAVGRRQLEPVHRRDRDDDVGLGRRELGDDAAGAGERARSACSAPPIAASSNGVAERHAIDRDVARAARRRRRRGRRRTPATAIASAPAFRSSLIRSSSPAPSIGPLIVIVTPRPVTGSRPGVGPDATQVASELVDRDVAASLVGGQRRELALERGDLAAQLVVARVEVGDEHGQVLRRELGQRRSAGLGPELDDDEHAEQERHGGDRDLVAASCIMSAAGTGDGTAPGPGDGASAPAGRSAG